MEENVTKTPTFLELGLSDCLLETLNRLKFTKPTPIQVECIPPGIQGRDIIGIAPTGSGKTAVFALPVLHHLWDKPQGLFACVLAPTRELAYQISSQFEALGATMGIRTAVVVGDDDRVKQAVGLAKKPHIIVATPGRLLDHLKATKGFNLNNIKFMGWILDEADRLLDCDFGVAVDGILKAIPAERITYLFSATLTDKVARLQRANLRNPVKIQMSTKYSTVASLLQYYLLCPIVKKEAFLVCLLNLMAQNSAIVFVRTKANMSKGRSIALKAKDQSIKDPSGHRHSQPCSGLDIPSVEVVINYDCPTHSKDYIHRRLDRKLDLYPQNSEEVDPLRERVGEAGRVTTNKLREKSMDGKRARKRKHLPVDADDEEEIDGVALPSGVKKKRRS
ncbi:ribosomal RNA processing protein [Marasmius sp. AFHP31]|nr:ribosomal RNA processing protein [Marasmius sp. AFHP31]